MLKKLELCASVVLFLLMLIFLSKFETMVLPFGIAFCGIISCGGLAIILLMHGANLSFTIDFAENEVLHEATANYVIDSNCSALSADLPTSWISKTNAA